MKKKIFKSFRHFNENITNDSRFSNYVYNRSHKKKWIGFKKPLFSKQSFFKVSNYFSTFQLEKKKQVFFSSFQSSFKTFYLLSFSLVKVRFCRSLAEAVFFIKIGLVFVNGFCVKSHKFHLVESDFVEFCTRRKELFFKSCIDSLFFTRYNSVTVVIQMGQNFEISFGQMFFIVCFLFFKF